MPLEGHTRLIWRATHDLHAYCNIDKVSTTDQDTFFEQFLVCNLSRDSVPRQKCIQKFDIKTWLPSALLLKQCPGRAQGERSRPQEGVYWRQRNCPAAPGVGGCRREEGIPNTVTGHNPVQHRGSSGLGGWRARWREEQEQEARSLLYYYYITELSSPPLP